MTRGFAFVAGTILLGADAYRVRQKTRVGPDDEADAARAPVPIPERHAPPPVEQGDAQLESTTPGPTLAPGQHRTPPPPHAAFRWHYLCNGYLTPHIRTADLGSGVGANNVAMCKSYCSAHNLCNAITFDSGSGICWLNTVASKPNPDIGHCDSNAGGLSFWLGETDGNPFLSLAESWQKVCTGYLEGHHPGRSGLGHHDGVTSVEVCKDECDSNWRCTAVVFDGHNCWLEDIPLRPSADSCNGATWAQVWWRGSVMLTELEPSPPSTAVLTYGHTENVGAQDPDANCSSAHMKFDEGCFYKCETDLPLQIAASSKKGLALDDTTLHYCPDNMHFKWPNTNEPVTSFRMFKAWAPWWNEPWVSKEAAWTSLSRFLNASHARVLVGTQISCNEEDDDADWENVKAMIRIFGAEHIMGLAIGNELELLWTQSSVYNETVLPDCLDRVWNQGYFLNKFHDRVRELDEMGEAFRNIPVTSVFGGFILAEPGWPFYESTDENIARVNTFINSVTYTYGDRYVHTVNIYPYFEEGFVEYDDPSSGEASCFSGLEHALCIGTDDPDSCMLTWMIHRIRQRLHALGRPNATLWLGETGWSYPAAHTLATKMRQCQEWSTPASKAHYYQNFLSWDMELNNRYRGPDHIFYFAMRDSTNFGYQEGFGLVGDGDPFAWCTNTTCEMQQSSLSVTSVELS